jgi:hypothetical protein
MAGTEEETVAAAEDDALYVLTAVLLTPAQFPSVLGDDYPEACAALGLGPLADGYGLVIGQDGEGARWTVVIDDVSLVAVAIASWDCGMEYDLSPDERTVVVALPGWPLSVAVAAPNVPAPHDPGPDIADGPLLSPPDTSVWGPAQRRLGADEIALQWAVWREQVDDSEFIVPEAAPEAASDTGNTTGPEEPAGARHAGVAKAPDASEVAEATEAAEVVVAPAGAKVPVGSGPPVVSAAGSLPVAGSSPDGDPGTVPASAAGGADPGAGSGPETHPREAPRGRDGIRRVLAEAHAYVSAPPPLGRVRSSYAPGDARTLRADGPGWSMVARTDDIAFVLLDGAPGEVLPVGRGSQLPALLEALDRLAVRPS